MCILVLIALFSLFIFFFILKFFFYSSGDFSIRFGLFILMSLLLNIFFSFFLSMLSMNSLVSAQVSFFQLYESSHALFGVDNAYLCFVYPFALTFYLIVGVCFLLLLSYNRSEISYFFAFLLLIFIAGSGLFTAASFFSFLFFYELLVVPSVFILYFFAKTRKNIEASYLMFFWTQLGVVFLLFGFVSIYTLTGITSFYPPTTYSAPLAGSNSFFLFLFFFVGFGVKFPVWPFYDWLPKAHVEASTNFSIFLSGALVKLAFFGFLRTFYAFFYNFPLSWFIPLLFVGLVKASFCLFIQIDLKKIIAYLTIVEMHWLTLLVFLGDSSFWFAFFLMLISHALISTNFFFLVDAISRRFKSRLVFEVSGIFFLTPQLYYSLIFNLVIVLGFPGSSLFLSEFLFFLFLLEFNLIFTALWLFFTHFFVLSIFFKHWFLILFGHTPHFYNSSAVLDLKIFEVGLVLALTLFLFVLGFCNSLFWIFN